MLDNSILKIIQTDKYSIIFNSQEMSLGIIPNLFSIKNNFTGIIYKHFKIKDLNLLSNFNCLKFSSFSESVTNKTNEFNQFTTLQRLSLNISNLCNFSCKYCYANQGRYDSDGILMDQDTAFNAINYSIKNYSSIKHINFFGGEPTLNKKILELICEYILYLNSRGIINYLPSFGITTNGYSIDKSFLNIIQKYRMSICISLDGPKEIHDTLRVNNNNSGTFQRIINNIKKLLDYGITPQFECTYTAEHYRHGITIIELMNFFYEYFNNNILHCPAVIVKRDSDLYIPLNELAKFYNDAIEQSFLNLYNNVYNIISIVARLLNSLINKIPIYDYCPAGKTSISINANGSIYPCFMLINFPNLCFGNVNNLLKRYKTPFQFDLLLQSFDKKSNPICNSCWIRPLCFGCWGEDLWRENVVISATSVYKNNILCDFKKQIVEIFLKKYVKYLILQN